MSPGAAANCQINANSCPRCRVIYNIRTSPSNKGVSANKADQCVITVATRQYVVTPLTGQNVVLSRPNNVLYIDQNVASGITTGKRIRIKIDIDC